MDGKRDFPNVTRIWVSILTIFGLSCVTQTFDQTYKISYYKIIYSALLCASLCTAFYYQLIIFTAYTVDFSTKVIRFYIFCSGNLASISLIILIIKTAKDTSELLSDVIRFDRKYRWDVRMSARLFLPFVASGMMLSLNFTWDYLQFVHNSGDSGIAVKFLLLVYIFPVYTSITVGQISFQMKWLHGHLEKFIELLENFDFPKTEEINFKKFHSQMWQDELETRDLIELRSIYHKLYEISKKMNKTNSGQCILTIGQCFIIGTLHMYFSLVAIFHPPKQFSPSFDVPVWVSYFRWSVCSYLAILTIIYPCQSVVNKAKKVTSAVQSLRIKTSKPKLRGELENFLIQLMEEKIEFSAHGFFQINNRLLLSLLSAAASYLIILIQSRVKIE